MANKRRTLKTHRRKKMSGGFSFFGTETSTENSGNKLKEDESPSSTELPKESWSMWNLLGYSSQNTGSQKTGSQNTGTNQLGGKRKTNKRKSKRNTSQQKR
jgi:hypothetical protein